MALLAWATFENKGFSRIGKLVANRDIFSVDIVERDSAGPQLVLEIVQQLQLPLSLVTILKFLRGLNLGTIFSPSVFHIHIIS